MPAATANLLRDLCHAWSSLPALPSLPTTRFERWSMEAAQVMQLIADLPRGTQPEQRDVDRQLLGLAERCRRLGDCAMSEALAGVAAGRFASRGELLFECQAIHQGIISIRTAGERDRAAERLAELMARALRDHPGSPLTNVVTAHHAEMLPDAVTAAQILRRTLTELEGFESQVFAAGTGIDHGVELGRRQRAIVRVLLAQLWIGHQSETATRDIIAEVEHRIAAARRAPLPEDEHAALDVLAAELEFAQGRESDGLARLRALEERASADSRIGAVLAPTYRLLAQFEARHAARDKAIEFCRRALLASLHFGNRPHEHLAVETFMTVMRRSQPLDEGSPEVEHLAKVVIEMLEAKDWYTGRNHSQSVGSLAQRVGKHLLNGGHGRGSADNPDDWIDLGVLRLAGRMHDVGKLTIPWSLLNKISPLSSLELDTLRSHVRHSELMLNALGLGRIGRIAGEHHERPDGKGYPRSTTQLSLMGAIIAVGDAFEAMITANRRYRARLNAREAVAELARNRGTMFDARVVDAMIALHGSGRESESSSG